MDLATVSIAQLVTEGARAKRASEDFAQLQQDCAAELIRRCGPGEQSGDGCKALIVHPAPAVKPDAGTIAALKTSLPQDKFGKLFERLVVFKPVKAFRAVAAAILTPAAAAKLFARVEVESKPYVKFS